MNIKKILIILISLVMILNMLIPTVALAANEVKGKTEGNNTEIESTKEDSEKEENNETEDSVDNTIENGITDNETTDNETVNEVEDNTVKNNTTINEEVNENNNQETKVEESTDKNVQEGNSILETQNLDAESVNTALSVSYRAHVENEGWQEYVQDGATAGTTGKALEVEAINIQLVNNTDKNLKIKYEAHVENIGWQGEKQDGEMAGTTGQNLHIEAIKIELENTEDYSIMYRAHVENIGWQDWKTDGEIAGTTGQDLGLEAIEIKIVEKQKKVNMCIDTPANGTTYYSLETSSINVSGWKMANVSNTYIRAYVDNTEVSSETISYSKREDVIQAITGYGTAKENPTPGFSFSVDTSNLESGTHTIKIEVYSNSEKLSELSTNFNIDKALHVQYKSHVENEGWQDYVQDGATAGTTGKALEMEAINIQLVNNTDKNLKIKYEANVENIGWQGEKQGGEMAGTEGQNLHIEAIKIELENTEDYSIMYRAHVENIGWQDWKTDGEIAGTTGQDLGIEAIEIKIVEREKKVNICIDTPANGTTYYKSEASSINVSGWKMANVSNTYIRAYVDDTEVNSEAISYGKRQDVIDAITGYGTEKENPNPGFSFSADISNLSAGSHTITIEVVYKDKVLSASNTTFNIDSNIHIRYSAHVENIGWQDYVLDGATAGTIGRALEIEAMKIELVNVPNTAHIKYRAYVYRSGWTDWVQDGEQVGTTGENKKIQAVQIEIEGLDEYVVEYDAHVENIGWQPWAANGMEAGTSRKTLGIEGLNIRLVKEEDSIVPQVKYCAHIENGTWTSYSENGETLGSDNGSIKFDAIKIALENSKDAHIKYSVHVQDIGWLDDVQDDAQSGTGSAANGIEAIKINLEGLDGYSVEYRAYVIGEGWQDWVRDGIMAGTTGKNLKIGAIQIRIVLKDDNRSFSNFEDLDESKYPGYKEKLRQLQNQHPNWIITIDYTGLDWNTVLDNEDQLLYDNKGNITARSLTQYGNQWKNGDTQYGTGWYRASRAAIAYMMDPRNSLDESYVFQFQDLTSSAGTYSDISRMIQGTFLTKYTAPSSTDSVINTILECSETYKISPYHLVSRMLQEQGTNGSTLNGYVYSDGRKVYNLFNIGATGNSDAEIIQNGATYAYNNHWFTPEACIEGSAQFLYDGYLSQGQTTLYYQKYDVVTPPYYTHQYMQNIRAANDEGKRVSDEYKANGMINGEFEFLIPVYENMPSTVSPRPAT